MNIKNLPPLAPLDKSTAPAQKDPRDPKMLDAAKSFENQFIRQMISEMRKTVPKDDLVENSMADDIFREQLDDHYADTWTGQGGVGIADMIYDQLQDKYGKQKSIMLPKGPGEVLPLKASAPQIKSSDKHHDIFASADKSLFLAKPMQGGFDIKAKDPLPERVDIKTPMSGIILQTAALEDGREMIVVKHDEGLVSQFVHTGRTLVKINDRVTAGDTIAVLPPSQKGELAKVNFRVAPGT
jgi:flagellar protein FlgJ